MPREKNRLEESPLMNKPIIQSTINPDKMEQSRFTDMVERESDGTSPLRIVLYAVIIIAVGVIAALVVRTLISNQQPAVSEQTNQAQTNDQQQVKVTPFRVTTAKKADSSASLLAANSDYIQSELVTLGDSKIDKTNVKLTSISFDRFTTFGRLTFSFSGNNSKLIESKITFDSVNKTSLSVDFKGLTQIETDLKKLNMISDLVESVDYDNDNMKFVIILADSSKFRAVELNGNLLIDFKTEDDLKNPSTTTSTTPTNTTTPSTTISTTKPAAPFYDNEFSRNQQYISSAVKDNSIAFNNYWIWDEGSFFEFGIGISGKVGNTFIPNVTSYLKEESGKNYLYLEVENLTSTPLSQSKKKTAQQLVSETSSTIDTSKINFIQVDLVSFTNGKATYKIEMKNKADYKLLSQLSFDKNSQIISIRIKD